MRIAAKPRYCAAIRSSVSRRQSPESPDSRSLLVQTPFKAEDFTFNESGEIPDIDYLIIRILNRSLDVSTLIIDLTVDGPHLEFDKPSSSW